ncbi:MAG TPA: GMC family oxidoreductase [Longimicrobiaceae bacterium]|nr:GMC family oxidoreductase [Longimicrobiaceae bacterium]
MPRNTVPEKFDALVIGSGFGGSMVAHSLVGAGARVLMLERGDWVERGPENWAADGAFLLTRHYTKETPYRVLQSRRWEEQGICACVGGPSVFYGGASFRYREQDFTPRPDITAGSGAEWPIDYADLAPHYTEAERLLGVAGRAGDDPTEPPRSGPYPAAPAPIATTSRRIADAARGLGLHPFRIPLAISSQAEGEGGCVACTTCDGFACAVGAKNDLATRVLPDLLARGLELRPNTVVVRLLTEGGKAVGVECFDKAKNARVVHRADRVILAAGALASPHLLLSSGLERMSTAPQAVGRYLMRHCNAMIYGVFPRPPDPANEHHKQIAIQDFYFGTGSGDSARKLGNIQQVMTPPVGLVRAMLPPGIGHVAARLVPLLTGLLVIAEDQPRAANGVEIDRSRTDSFGLPGLRVTHRYSARDLKARRALAREAKKILRAAGARLTVTWNVNTFSHAVGTVRLGADPTTAPLDENCAFRGVENLYVVDGSFMPTSAGLNPSLTIAANALRVGKGIGEF